MRKGVFALSILLCSYLVLQLLAGQYLLQVQELGLENGELCGQLTDNTCGLAGGQRDGWNASGGCRGRGIEVVSPEAGDARILHRLKSQAKNLD